MISIEKLPPSATPTHGNHIAVTIRYRAVQTPITERAIKDCDRTSVRLHGNGFSRPRLADLAAERFARIGRPPVHLKHQTARQSAACRSWCGSRGRSKRMGLGYPGDEIAVAQTGRIRSTAVDWRERSNVSSKCQRKSKQERVRVLMWIISIQPSRVGVVLKRQPTTGSIAISFVCAACTRIKTTKAQSETAI